MIGRLTDGSALEDAQSQMAVIADRLARDYPDANRNHGVHVYTLTQGMVDEGTGPMLCPVASVGLDGVAHRLRQHRQSAARPRGRAPARDRGPDRARRGRGRVIRELFTESVLLALLAVPPALGFAVAEPAHYPRQHAGQHHALRSRLRVAGTRPAAAGLHHRLAVVTACLFGVLPARAGLAQRASSEALKEGGRSSTGRQLLRRGIVVAEMAIALPLLVAAGLGVIGTTRFLNGPQGYDPDGVLTMKLVLPDRIYHEC